MNKTTAVAIAGLGTVGRETVRLLLKEARRAGTALKLVAVCDRQAAREARALGLSRSILRVNDPKKLARLDGVDIVVELMGGLDAPRRLVLDSLTRGRHVVTANKKLLSHCWGEIQAASRRGGARLGFEASVAGGIPIIEALQSGLAADRIDAVYGILNGTSNFVLSRAETGLEPAEALREAQRLGLAEKDPTLDLDGTDTAHKVSVLASLLTGSPLAPSRIAREGILHIGRDDVRFAKEELGCAIRLLGVLRMRWSRSVRVEAHVAPTLVPLSHPLAGVHGEFNAVLVSASPAGELMFYGKGAGPGPTASAVVGDILRLVRETGGPNPRKARTVILEPPGRSASGFYLRLYAKDRPGVLAQITRALGARGISIATIDQSPQNRSAGVPVVITTHPTPAGELNLALQDILSLKTVSRRHTLLRMLS